MEYLGSDHCEFSSGDNKNGNGGAHFTMDDLLDFSKEDEGITDPDGFLVNSGDSSTLTPVESCNSSVSGGPEPLHCQGKISCRSSLTDSSSQFPGNELCVPYDDLAELEWLPNFVEESFSNEDLGCLIPATATATDTSSSITAIPAPVQVPTPPPATFPPDVSVPGKARSKRPRAPPCDWSSRVLHVAAAAKKQDTGGGGSNNVNNSSTTEAAPTGRKCLHCASEKTPQWRTGPMGPKTLCNACGVRYKSGRLVPEYRPAASPTFVSNKHSNSHRKVLELRRQKEQQRQQQQVMGHASIFNGCDDFMIHHHNAILSGHDLRHMM